MKKIKLSSFLFFAVVFLFFLLYYTQIHPLIPYNSDDWMFMSANRIALPSIHAWNPSRVLPETLMPFFSDLAAYLIYPITNDYIGAQCMMHSFVVSIFLTLYLIVFYRLLTRSFGVERMTSFLLTAFFLLLHYLVLRTGDTNNVHLFYSDDLTCHYFYLIPNLVNAMLVMSLVEHDWLVGNNFTNLRNGIIALVVYLAICSNLYCSDILVVYIGCQLLMSYPYKAVDTTMTFVKINWIKISIIALWLIVNIMELMGPRSAYLAQEAGGATLCVQFIYAVKTFTALRYNLIFLVIAFVVMAYGIWIYLRERKLPQVVIHLIFTVTVTFVYVLIVSSKVKPAYMQRPDILFAVFFPILLLIVLGVVSIIRQCKRAIIAFPILMVIMFSQVNRSASTFRDLRINSFVDGDYTIETLRRVDNDIINQLVKADLTNTKDSVNITVPLVTNDEKNWPYLLIYNNGYNWLNKTLCKHNVIEREHPGRFVVGKPLAEY